MQKHENVESLFLEVNKAIDQKNLSDAKELLEEIIMIDPGFGRAHNHLAWIYDTEFKHFEKAKKHYELAIKFCKGDYPVSYVNYAYLLIDFEYFDEALRVIDEALQIKGSDKATLYLQKGKIYENKKQRKKAYKFFKEAKLHTYNKEFEVYINKEIRRIERKLSFFEKLF